MSINDVTPAEWDRVTKEALKKVQLPDPIDWLDDTDMVDKPAHYNKGEIEAIDYIKQQLGDDFYAYCEGNVHKYLHRYGYKNGIEDLRKARWYLDKLIKELCDV